MACIFWPVTELRSALVFSPLRCSWGRALPGSGSRLLIGVRQQLLGRLLTCGYDNASVVLLVCQEWRDCAMQLRLMLAFTKGYLFGVRQDRIAEFSCCFTAVAVVFCLWDEE